MVKRCVRLPAIRERLGGYHPEPRSAPKSIHGTNHRGVRGCSDCGFGVGFLHAGRSNAVTASLHPTHVNKLILGVGLFGPLVVVCGLVAADVVHSLRGSRGSDADVDEPAGTPRRWLPALLCGCALAVADPIVAVLGYHAPLAILARTALGGAVTGLIVGRALAIGDGAAMMLVAVLWPIAIAIGYAIHLGALWLALTAF